jgi:hypothetical protein
MSWEFREIVDVLMLYAFFWVNPQRLASEFQTLASYPEESIQHSEHESLKARITF